jgi:hypothetical protein
MSKPITCVKNERRTYALHTAVNGGHERRTDMTISRIICKKYGDGTEFVAIILGGTGSLHKKNKYVM